MTDARPPASREKKLVLIIDDETTLRETLKTRLESFGFSCVTSCNGRQGWQELETRIPHVVLLNIGIPSEEGLSFLHRLRSFRDPNSPQRERQFRQMPVIVVTGTGDGVRSLFEQERISAFIKKPVDFQVLKKLIEENLSGPARQKDSGTAESMGSV